MYWCGNRCIDKAIRYWQMASFGVEDDGEAHTINLCQQCYNDRLKKQGQPQLKLWEQGASWQDLENDGKGAVYTRNVAVLLS